MNDQRHDSDDQTKRCDNTDPNEKLAAFTDVCFGGLEVILESFFHICHQYNREVEIPLYILYNISSMRV